MPYITDREPFRKEASLVISNTLPELPDGDLKLWRTPCCVVREHLHNHPMGQELETAFDQGAIDISLTSDARSSVSHFLCV